MAHPERPCPLCAAIGEPSQTLEKVAVAIMAYCVGNAITDGMRGILSTLGALCGEHAVMMQLMLTMSAIGNGMPAKALLEKLQLEIQRINAEDAVTH